MSRIEFSLAGPGDEVPLRKCLADVWMPCDWLDGARTISLRREPDYFGACRLQGDETQVLIGRDRVSGEIAVTGARHIATTFLRGRPTRTAFLSDLRIAPAHRNGLLLARGYRFLRELHRADPLPCHNLIYEANTPALDMLTGARAGLPASLPRGRLMVHAIPLRAPLPPRPLAGLEMRRATADELDTVIGFINRHRAAHDWAPVLRRRDFQPGGRCDTLAPEHFFLALRGGRLCGTVAAWDQTRLRQVHVGWTNAPASTLPYLYWAFITAAAEDLPALRALLRHAYNDLCGTPWRHALAAMHEDDPLAPALTGHPARTSAVRLYEVDFGVGSEAGMSGDARSARVEFAMT